MNKQRVVSVLISLALLFSFASVSPAQAALPKVALLGSETGDRLTDIVNKVTAAGVGLYEVTNLTGCALATPSLATLQQYDSVLVWSDCLFANSTTLGDVLADYVDGGGRVVLASHVWWAYTHSGTLTLDIRGRFANEGYNPLQLGSSGVGGPIWSLVANDPASPLLAGVNSVTVLGIDNTTSIAPGATLVAHVTPGGHPLVAYKGNVVALNFFPASNQVQGGGWVASTDGARLIANALLFNATPPDTSAPTASPSQAPIANGAGWNNSDVTVTWNWADEAGGSGIDNANCTTSSVSTGEGAITLNATCKDLAGNTGNASYAVQVDKTTPTLNPVISPNPVPLNGAATVTSGAADALSGLASEGCGSLDTSSAGAKSVTCTATDNAGNTNSVNATYAVLSPAEQITALVTTINSFNLNGGTANSLTSKLDNAAKSLGKNNTNGACGQVDAFINQVNALNGNQLTAAQAVELLASTNQLKTSIGCA